MPFIAAALPASSLRAAQVLLLLVALTSDVFAQVPESPPVANWVTRECKANSPSSKKSARKSKKNERQADSTDACLEVGAASLDVQERLQAVVRDGRWNISDEDTDQFFWTFSVQLSKDELEADTKPDATAVQMEWTSGKALVMVQTSELSGGYTRLTVSAKFDGFGESKDKFATERAAWELKSNGRLEAGLIAKLRKRLKGGSQAPIENRR